MDVFQMLQNLAHSPYPEGMEVVVVTGLNSDEVAEKGGLPQGVILPKPVPFLLLREIAEQLLLQQEQVECLG